MEELWLQITSGKGKALNNYTVNRSRSFKYFIFIISKLEF